VAPLLSPAVYVGSNAASKVYLGAQQVWSSFSYDADAAAYITAVETADGQALEENVKLAINSFVVGCKADGVWSAIKASCILAGARTLNGALTPLVGTAPTNANFSGEADPNWSNVSLLLRGEGADGGTTFTDSSSNRFAASVFASSVLSTGASSGKFGSGIRYVDTGVTSASILYNNPVQLQFGTGDFTWEAWIRPDVAPSVGFFNVLWDSRASGESLTNRFYADFHGGGDNRARAIVAGTSIYTSSLSVGQWYHFAVCRSSGVSRVFLNGVLQGSVSDSFNYSNGTSRPVLFNNLNLNMRGVGYSVDEIRVTKGVARYTSDFTIPATAFPGSSSSDYSRTTGLVGDGSTKYLNSNRANNADPQNNSHMGVYVSTVPTVGVLLIGAEGLSSTGTSALYGGGRRYKNSTSDSYSVGSMAQTYYGLSRASSTQYTVQATSSQTVARPSQTPESSNILLYRRGAPSTPSYSNARLSFYSIGESLDLALLGSRVTALVNEVAFYLNTGLNPADYDIDTLKYINAGYAAGGSLS